MVLMPCFSISLSQMIRHLGSHILPQCSCICLIINGYSSLFGVAFERVVLLYARNASPCSCWEIIWFFELPFTDRILDLR